MEENAPFPESLTPQKHLEIEPTKNSNDDKEMDIQENPSNLEEAFKLTLSRQDRAKKNEEFQNFQSSRPQESRFKYGTGMEFNKITESKKMEEKAEITKPTTNPGTPKASDDPRIKDSTDESSDEGLKTSSSVKSSDDELKRKKDPASTDSDASVKHDDKKLRFASDLDSGPEKRDGKTDTEEI